MLAIRSQPFVRSESPLFVDFLETYYASQEFEGGTLDISQNIDQYVKVGTYSSIVSITLLDGDVDFIDETIFVDSTEGFPKEYGLLKIDDEIITYKGKTDVSFTNCVRGFLVLPHIEILGIQMNLSLNKVTKIPMSIELLYSI